MHVSLFILIYLGAYMCMYENVLLLLLLSSSFSPNKQYNNSSVYDTIFCCDYMKMCNVFVVKLNFTHGPQFQLRTYFDY